MVERPNPWTAEGGKPYRTLRANIDLFPVPGALNREHREYIQESLKGGRMDTCLEALNYIGQVPLAINQDVLELIKVFMDRELDFEKNSLPSGPLKALPEMPIGYEEMEPSVKARLRRKRSRVIVANRERTTKKLIAMSDVDKADEIGERDFYLPARFDFRARVYPIPYLSHHRADHVRALINFADGGPVDEEAAAWLRINLANLYGHDKLSLEQREAWARDPHVEGMLRAISENPLESEELAWWSQADSPWQFYAAACDYVRFLDAGEGYMSHIPIYLDGTCSGLQHYAAALRGEEDGRLVNLTALDERQDLYQAVCDETNRLLREETAKPELAGLLLNWGVSRKIVKRAAMTYFYSSRQRGFADQFFMDLPRRDLEGALSIDGDGGRQVIHYLAGVVELAIQGVVSKADEGLRFLQEVASALASEDRPLQWETPLGFPFANHYQKPKFQQTRLWLYDKAISARRVYRPKIVVDNEPALRKHKVRNAVAPNVIHSLDATHLMMVALQSKQEGIDLLLIHDAFATNAANTSRFFYLIREEFVRLYAECDPFTDIQETAAAALQTAKARSRLPEPPAKGTLDIEEVLDSDFAFS
jgi:DNA-directed RNA polymerase